MLGNHSILGGGVEMYDRPRELAILLRKQELKRKAAQRIAEKLSALTPRQLKAARDLLDWSQTKLAVAVGVTDVTIRSFEVGRSLFSQATLAKVHQVLERHGVVLLKDGVVRNGEGVVLLPRETDPPS